MLKPAIATLDVRIARPMAKRRDPLYIDPRYLKWRAIVLARAGKRCQWPGCGKATGRLFADHIHEIKDGGDPFNPANGQAHRGTGWEELLGDTDRPN